MDRLQTLAIYQRVCESHSFTKAAVSLNLPRSTVTQAIQRLEQQLNMQLLQRTTRQVRLTESGTAVLEKARQLLADWDELAGLFAEDHQPSGVLRISVPTHFARMLIIPALAEFRQRYPGIELNIGVTDSRVDLLESGVDLVLRAGPLNDSNLIGRDLGAIPIVTLASPGYLQQFGVPLCPDDLNEHQMVGYVLPSSGRVEPLEFLLEGKYQKLMLPHPITTNGSDAYIAAGLAGMGLVQVPVYGIAQYLQQGLLQRVLADYPPSAMPIAMLYPKNRNTSQRLQVFIDWLSQTIREQVPLQRGVPR